MLTLALALVLPSHASGYYFADSGTRAIARGGAVVAGTDDLMAMYYNPGALTRIDRPTLNVNGWLTGQYVRFDRAAESDCGAEDCDFAAVENQAPAMKEPSFGFATPLGRIHPALDQTVLAVGLYPPTGPSFSYDPTGPQRYTLIESMVLQAWAGPSIATRVTPWLSVGAGLQWSFLEVSQGLAASLCLTEEQCAQGTDNPANDIRLEVGARANDILLNVEASDFNQWSGNVGVLIQPTPWLDIGASWQPGSSYEAEGSLSATFNEDFPLATFLDGLSFTDEDVLLKVTLPQTVRVGAQVRPTERLQVELAGTWTQWSALDKLTVTNLDLLVKGNPDGLVPDGFLITSDVDFPTGYEDSFSVRLGGDYAVTENVKVALGGHYESSAVPPKTQGVNLVDGDKWGLGGGGTFRIGKHLSLDVAAAGTLLPSRTITDSELTQVAMYANVADPDAAGVVDGKVVGNGEFESRLSFVGVGVTWAFGDAPTP